MAADGTQGIRAHRLTDTEVSTETLGFLEWYQGLWRRRGRPPSRQDTDPLDVPELLPWLWFYESTGDGDYLCRFSGERIDRRWRHTSVQFQKLSEILPQERVGPVFNRIEQCLRHVCIAHGWTNVADPVSSRRVERCFAPVTDEEGRPNAVVGVALYGNPIIAASGADAPKSVERLGLYDPVSLELVIEVD